MSEHQALRQATLKELHNDILGCFCDVGNCLLIEGNLKIIVFALVDKSKRGKL